MTASARLTALAVLVFFAGDASLAQPLAPEARLDWLRTADCEAEDSFEWSDTGDLPIVEFMELTSEWMRRCEENYEPDTAETLSANTIRLFIRRAFADLYHPVDMSRRGNPFSETEQQNLIGTFQSALNEPRTGILTFDQHGILMNLTTLVNAPEIQVSAASSFVSVDDASAQASGAVVRGGRISAQTSAISNMFAGIASQIRCFRNSMQCEEIEIIMHGVGNLPEIGELDVTTLWGPNYSGSPWTYDIVHWENGVVEASRNSRCVDYRLVLSGETETATLYETKVRQTGCDGTPEGTQVYEIIDPREEMAMRRHERYQYLEPYLGPLFRDLPTITQAYYLGK